MHSSAIVSTDMDISLVNAWEKWEKGMSVFRKTGDSWLLGYGHQQAAMAMFFTALRPSRTMARLIEPI